MPTKENIELFKSALYEGVANKMREIEEEIKNPAMPPEIKRQKEENLRIFLENSDNKWGAPAGGAGRRGRRPLRVHAPTIP